MIIAPADFRVVPKIGEVGAIQACRSSVARAREASNRLECLLWGQTRTSSLGPHVRFRRGQTLVREASPLVKLRNSA
jgi:hypothetical protein